MKKLILTTCMVALLAAPAMAQVDFTRYVALGDSLTAGVASGSIMDYYQVRSYPQLLATQAGAGLLQGPFIAPPGLQPILELKSLSPLSIGPTEMPPPADPFEYFYNLTLEAPYQNLGLSGANTNDLLTKTGNALNLVAGNFDNVVYDITLRVPQQPDPNTGDLIDYTAMVAAIGQQPTFLTVWIGSNDVLGAVLAATPIDGITMTPLDAFAADYATLIGGLAMSLPSTDIVIMTIFGDARWLPFATTVPTAVTVPGIGTVPLMGEAGPLGPGDYLTLPAAGLLGQGMGLPIPGSPPLPENLNPATGAPGVVLRAAEIEVINERLASVNGIIAGVAAQFPNVHLFDVNNLFADVVNGDYRTFGGIELSNAFLVGGIFSYDGFHPQNVGQAVVAGALIDFINDEFNADLPQLNMYAILNEGGWNAASPFAAICGGCDPKSAVMTREAFMQLYSMMLPELAARWDQPHLQRQTHSSSVD
jgi:lysophospholipase L1-like esterase